MEGIITVNSSWHACVCVTCDVLCCLGTLWRAPASKTFSGCSCLIFVLSTYRIVSQISLYSLSVTWYMAFSYSNRKQANISYKRGENIVPLVGQLGCHSFVYTGRWGEKRREGRRLFRLASNLQSSSLSRLSSWDYTCGPVFLAQWCFFLPLLSSSTRVLWFRFEMSPQNSADGF